MVCFVAPWRMISQGEEEKRGDEEEYQTRKGRGEEEENDSFNSCKRERRKLELGI